MPTTGHGAKSERKQEQAIAALLTCATIPQAAKQVGISESTLDNWLKEPEFLGRYRAARRQAMENAIALLQKATTSASAALMRNLKCGQAGVEVRAALGIFDLLIKWTAIEDQEQRLTELERLMAVLRSDSQAGHNGKQS
jgi:hypothetical protein